MPPKSDKLKTPAPSPDAPIPLAPFPNQNQNQNPNSSIGKGGKNRKCCKPIVWTLKFALTVLFGVITVAAILVALILVISASVSAASIREYNNEYSGKSVCLIILALAAAGSIVVLIWGLVVVCKNKAHLLHFKIVIALLVILAILEIIIVSLAAVPSKNEEVSLTRSLVESFREARTGDPAQLKNWDSTQDALSCCGVFSPEDYRLPNQPNFIPPEIPISCCESYDPNRSTASQEREREICKARKVYYQRGCKDPVQNLFREGGHLLIGLVIILLLLQLITVTVLSVRLYKKWKAQKDEENA